MPDLPFDVAVANRFISSLSKSLQALCHGCMEFNSGIEIVGYINVNIDCGSKADYVLNEKVLKSTTNSMTFVSNSFFAKKDQPRQTRDGTCSPIPQFETQLPGSPYQHRARGFSHSAFNRAGHHGSHFYRGTQKRGLGSEWRGSAKRHRPTPVERSSSQFASPMQGPTFDGSGLRQQHSHQQSDSGISSGIDSEGSLLNVKKEATENNETQPSPESSAQQTISGSSDLAASDLNIKSDPDGKSAVNNDSDTKVDTTESSDFKGTFLQPMSQDNQDGNDQTQSSETVDQMAMGDQPVSFETPFPNPESPSVSGIDKTSNESNSNTLAETVMSAENADNEPSDADANNEAAVEYDNATEEASYSEYPDAGEGSSSGQFEVIEIDDEDEDMQAMFGASRGPYVSVPWKQPSNENNGATSSVEHRTFPTYKPHNCTKCSAVFGDGFSLQEHLHKIHNVIMEYVCSECGRGYHTQSGLYYHVQSWHRKSVKCAVCDTKFARKSTMRAHLLRFHNMKQCIQCSQCINCDEYNHHRQLCSRNSFSYI